LGSAFQEEVKKSFFLVILAILVVELVLSRLSNSVISIADTGTSSNEVTSSVRNSSATATITMYTVAGNQPS